MVRGALGGRASMPSKVGRWPSIVFGVWGTTNTARFHGPLCRQRSVRLFLRWDLVGTSKQAFANDKAGISIGVAIHLALWTVHQGRAWGVSFCWFSGIIASNEPTTSSTLTTCIAGTHT